MTEYTHKTYDTMRVYVPAGMYSIAEIDQLLADMIEAKKQQEKALMQSLKEKNT
jgi:predicted lipoprotein